ncbi:MAG: hypothetical protein F4Z06_15415 [Acidimicrobiia bacterium]|nr:hypothetical protein [Acidimicrobiia bacterium]MYE73135.1 hypothetical protein [Acidimicrobiia bacterium]MYJ61789.1 hypothetical protein [Acidimicrobiia bacterium]
MAPFRRVTVSTRKSESPESLFDDLPPTRDGVPSLWAHQADMLREYHSNHLATPDIALELPTGAGKTLPALLIAEWRRVQYEHRVAYACPTVQLANQVFEEAHRQGIDAVALHGSHHNWDTVDRSKYERADSIAITTYNAIFNLKPALTAPNALVFDDVHTAEGIVASSWSVHIRRFEQLELYNDLLAAIGSELSGTLIQRLQESDPDIRTRTDVRLLPVAAFRRVGTKVDRILREMGGDLWYRYAMIREYLVGCLLYFGWEGFLIRPYIPPTNQHNHFTHPQQRLYISATLGHGGELERAFGRAPIRRLPVPSGWDQRGSGRRFVIFPELIRDIDARSLTKSVISHVGKSIILCPSNKRLEASIAEIVPSNIEIFDKGRIETSLDSFRTASRGVLALANRYDGIDLADESCRVTVLDGLPSGQHLQERFLVGTLRAGRVLEERLRTRIIQGAGRCTRGLKDYSVVIILGSSLTSFLQRKEVREALRPEVQAEIWFGIENSQVGELELKQMIDSCLMQNEDWQELAETNIAELRHELERHLPPGTEALASSAKEEVRAWNLVLAENFAEASQKAMEIAQQLGDGPLASYRAFWFYLSGEWLGIEAAQKDDAELKQASENLLHKAKSVARGTTWLRDLMPHLPEDVAVEEIDQLAAAAISDHNLRNASAEKWLRVSQTMLDGLEQFSANQFEPALTTLGSLLGSEAFKPPDKGNADSVWLFGGELWLTLEAKSDESVGDPVSLDTIRQANSHLKMLSADRQVEFPSPSISIVITPRSVVDPGAIKIAESHLYLCGPNDLIYLAKDVVEAWRAIRQRAYNMAGEDSHSIILNCLSEYNVLPFTLRNRLTSHRIAL